MSAKVLYRIAAIILILFAAGHTFGFLTFKPLSDEGRAVQLGMDNVKLLVEGQTFTYGGFYRGFGLFVTTYLLFFAYLAWHLGKLSATNPAAIGGLRWALVAVQVVCLVLCWMYFFPIAIIFSAAAAICTAWAALLVK